MFGPSSAAPWGDRDAGREGAGAEGAKGEAKEAAGLKRKRHLVFPGRLPSKC